MNDIRLIRFRLGVRQKDLAAACGVSSSYLSRVESGAMRASPNLRRRLAEALRVPEALVFDERDSERGHAPP